MSARAILLALIVPGLFLLAMPPAIAPEARADEPFALKGNERILFFGDSITQSGLYAQYIEVFLRTRFPDRAFTIINHGISSETVSGTTEPDHTPPRPNALDRFKRDVAAWKPDVVVACFGMNDGNYFPFEEERFEKYKKGVHTLIERVHKETKAKLFLLSPPAYDPYRRQVGDPAAKSFGYRFPAVDYDHTLSRYSDWLVGLDERGVETIDVHKAFNDHLRKRREELVSYYLSADAVHPNETGHWLMAQTLLLGWHAPASCAEVHINASTLKAQEESVSDVARDGEALRAVWRSPLPLPIDPAWDETSLEVARVSERLNRYRLTAVALPHAHYRLLARLEDDEDVENVAELSHEALAKGVDLTAFPAFPTNALALKVLAKIQQYQQANYAAWRKRIASDSSADGPPKEPDNSDILSEIRRLCEPKDVHLRLVPID